MMKIVSLLILILTSISACAQRDAVYSAKNNMYERDLQKIRDHDFQDLNIQDENDEARIFAYLSSLFVLAPRISSYTNSTNSTNSSTHNIIDADSPNIYVNNSLYSYRIIELEDFDEKEKILEHLYGSQNTGNYNFLTFIKNVHTVNAEAEDEENDDINSTEEVYRISENENCTFTLSGNFLRTAIDGELPDVIVLYLGNKKGEMDDHSRVDKSRSLENASINLHCRSSEITYNVRNLSSPKKAVYKKLYTIH